MQTLKKTKLLTLILALPILYSFSNATQAANEVWTGKVSRLYLAGNGTIYFKMKDLSEGCDFVHSNAYFTLPATHSQRDETYAMLLATAHSGLTISVRADDLGCQTSVFANQITYVVQNY